MQRQEKKQILRCAKDDNQKSKCRNQKCECRNQKKQHRTANARTRKSRSSACAKDDNKKGKGNGNGKSRSSACAKDDNQKGKCRNQLLQLLFCWSGGGWDLGCAGVQVYFVVGVVDLQEGVTEEEAVGMGFSVGGHGDASDFVVVTEDGGFSGEEGRDLRGCSGEADYGEIRGVDPGFADEQVRTFAARSEINDEAFAATDLDLGWLGAHFVVGGGHPDAFAVGGCGHFLLADEDFVDDGAAQDSGAALGDDGVLLSAGGNVRGSNRFLRGWAGFAVAKDGIHLLHAVAGESTGTAEDRGVDVVDDFFSRERLVGLSGLSGKVDPTDAGSDYYRQKEG